MTHRGWISLYRKYTEHYFYPTQEKRAFTRSEAWLDLLLNATHKEYKHSVYGNLVILDRGELLISERHLSKRWKWSRDKVKSFLNHLKTDKMIDLAPAIKKYDRNGPRLKITNYNTYQDYLMGSQTTNPTTYQSTNPTTYPTNNNNINNNNNDNKDFSQKDVYLECIEGWGDA